MSRAPIFVDVEASCFENGYPVEVGWADPDGAAGSVLILPPVEWKSRHAWSMQAERTHGISWQLLDSEGLDVRRAAETINAVLAGAMAVSDAPQLDWPWIRMLFRAARVDPWVELWRQLQTRVAKEKSR